MDHRNHRSDKGEDLVKTDAGHLENLRGIAPQQDFKSKLDKKIDRKFDLHIVPWLFGIWLFAFIDRSNIGNARVDGLATDLGIATGTTYNLALLVFYIPYILVDVPSNWIIKHVKAGYYLPTLITCWGLVSTFVGFTKSLAGLIVARLLLGAFEGGLLGGIIVYLAMFYRRHQMVRRIGFFYCAAPLSGAFGGLLATGLARISYNGYNRWPWIFFIEGIITTLFGIICFFTMPHTPAEAKFLTEEESARALTRLRLDNHGAAETGDVNQEHFDWHWVKMAFRAPQLWFCCLIWFFLLIPLYVIMYFSVTPRQEVTDRSQSFSLFLPTIISGLGYTNTVAQLFTVPPNMAAFFVVLGTSFLSDHLKARGPIMAVGCIVSIAGYIMLLAADQNSTRYGGTFLVAVGIFPSSAMTMGWISNNLAPHYVRATGVGFLIAFSNCAAFVATYIYLAKDAPRYILGHSICIGALVLCLATVCAQMAYCAWENKKRSSGQRDERLRTGEEYRLGHRHPHFRYTL
ncbi:major facilitator superfamily domain-containing protein [Truncatella angustata]|uniref:Major facilitator superfamily domain-containing protein n=1 Tax=Truncatella angustata TaxID=152316 RepID=A0A9P8UYN2_9PEZI|nr:major facilitator superfamily domain-containing protein [Truncatella angustata]KAH6660790.1 major facilitator superfamily domain-containing protein [Truncatella angustata]